MNVKVHKQCMHRFEAIYCSCFFLFGQLRQANESSKLLLSLLFLCLGQTCYALRYVENERTGETSVSKKLPKIHLLGQLFVLRSLHCDLESSRPNLAHQY